MSNKTEAVRDAQSEKPPQASLFFIDTGDREGVSELAPAREHVGRKAAWVDEDDEKVRVDLTAVDRSKKLRHTDRERFVSGSDYSERLRAQFEKLHPRPQWAQAAAESPLHSDADSEDSIMKSPFSILKPKSADSLAPLLPDVIGLRRLRDGNFVQPSRGKIVALEFHPIHPLMLVAGSDRVLNIFEIGTVENKLCFSLKIQDWPILCAKFTSDGEKVIISGSGPSLIVWSILEKRIVKVNRISGRKEKEWPFFEVSACGRLIALKGDKGYIVFLSAVSMQVVGTVRMNAEVTSMVFSSDGNVLFSVGGDNHIYVWATSSFRCVKIVPDDSGTICTSVAVSSDAAFLAVGSNIGVVNLYELDHLMNPSTKSAKPLRSLLNITTIITSAIFHPNGEIFAYSSNDRTNSLRLAHLPSGRVFANWPKNTTTLRHVEKIAFNSSGKMMAIGNNKGHVLLYSLRHYE